MDKVVPFKRKASSYNLYELVSIAIKHDVVVDTPNRDLDIIRVQYITALSRAGLLK